MISAQCSECQSDVSSKKRGCGSPAQAQAQATARVDVPTAAAFLCGPRSPTCLQVFVANAWICACQATDRDLESSSTRRRVNAWICARRATDRDLETKK